VIAVPNAGVFMPAAFYPWQLIRMIVVFIAAFRLVSINGTTDYVLYGIFAGVAYHMCFAVLQKAQGVAQASGELGAQNLLGLTTHFALVPALAMIVQRRRGALPWIALAAAATVELLTGSRATLGFAAIGAMLFLLLSCLKNFTGRKGAVLSLGIAGMLLTMPLALKSISARRAGNTIESSNGERAAFNRAAWMIIKDHPMGIGPNHYVLVANVGGYNQRAGVNWNGGSRSTSVHNSYLLAWAETGIFGFLTLILLLTVPVFNAIRTAFRFKHDERSDILLGLGIAIVVVSLHFLYEWLFVLFLVQYEFSLIAGTAAGLAALLRRTHQSGRAQRRPALGATSAGAEHPVNSS
jgi:O-antigen ligase